MGCRIAKLRKICTSVFLALLLAGQSSPAAAGSASIVLGPNLSSFASSVAEYSGNFGIAFGGLAELDLSGNSLGLEFGLLIAPRGYSFKQNGDTEEISADQSALELPILVRYHFNPMISFGAGLYYAHYLGTYDQETKNLNTGSSSINRYGYGDSAVTFTPNDFGLVFSLAGTYPVGGAKALLDIRHQIGLKNNDTRDNLNAVSRYREWQFLLGLQFAI